MKFWITVAIGIVVVTAISTAIFVANPDVQPPPANEQDFVPIVSGDMPKAYYDRLNYSQDNLPQYYTGNTEFVIENRGGSELSLWPEKPTCKCSGIKIVKMTDEPEDQRDYVDLHFDDSLGDYKRSASRQDLARISLEPQEKAQIFVSWETKDRVGAFSLIAPVHTNDPTNLKIEYRISLGVTLDIAMYPSTIEFGELNEGKKAEESTMIYSHHHEQFKILEPTVTSPSISVQMEPMTPDQIEERKCKSGYQVKFVSDGTLPVGSFYEYFRFKTDLERVPERKVELNGRVKGSISLHPPQIKFGVVAADTVHTKKVDIFATGLKEDDRLTVGEFEPAFLVVKLEIDPQFKTLWRLHVSIPANDCPSGPFKGSVSVNDQHGKKRVNVPVSGAVSKGSGATTVSSGG